RWVFILEPRKFRRAPFVKGQVPRRRCSTAKTRGLICRKAPLRTVGPFFPPKGNDVALITGLFLPDFPPKNGKADWPKHDKAQNHREDFHRFPGFSRRTSSPLASPGSPGRVRLTRHTAISTHLKTPLTALFSAARPRRSGGDWRSQYRYGFCCCDAREAESFAAHPHI